MAGHNKWSKVKHIKAKNDSVNSKVQSKILREIAVAVKEGGPDPVSNNKLRNTMLKARSNNMPNDTITRTIKKASGELGSINFTEMVYEGYGPAGSAVIVEALTDNKNRTAGDVRHIYDKFGGSMGQTGSVSFLFNRLGEIYVLRNDDTSEDDFMLLAIEAGASDVEVAESYFRVVTEPSSLDTVKNFLEEQNIVVEEAEVAMVPTMTIDLAEDKLKDFNKMLEMLEDNDDVQNVFHNVNLPDDTEEEF